ncbi:hypothetical protein LEP1GSC041_0313 [Leptospira noguchii str. 2006001870]|uniref:Uncharacterized protein n=1 Tax=Leptospira noguchii serovar Autumnalis str. ZUN142 TaxID=1085540 RepID=M6UB10_9LEPT|nr:hypothetical protein LEP1GSC041_0313 [Leptospira noguchii str. 2006001870]EMO42222.1 hypothetical protein LEP1GSC186_0430 [Leptospira noguchii serovar Autumnalis str. ZUN142]
MYEFSLILGGNSMNCGRNSGRKGLRDFSLSEKHTFCK